MPKCSQNLNCYASLPRTLLRMKNDQCDCFLHFLTVEEDTCLAFGQPEKIYFFIGVYKVVQILFEMLPLHNKYFMINKLSFVTQSIPLDLHVKKANHNFCVSQFAQMGFVGASLQKFCQVTPS